MSADADDLVKRLRAEAKTCSLADREALFLEAADMIEQMQQQIEAAEREAEEWAEMRE